MDFGRLHKARNWIGDWRDYDYLTDTIEHQLESSYRDKTPPPVRGVDFIGIPSYMLPYMNFQLLYSKPKKNVAPSPQTYTSRIRLTNKKLMKKKKIKKKMLRLSFISSDFGVHPVSSLIRGALMSISHRFQVTAYSLTNETSWWRTSITSEIDSMKYLTGLSWEKAAEIIYKDSQDIIVDLNGHTMGSGLPILAHSPAPIQLSYLGFSETTGAPFIHQFVADSWVAPPETLQSSFKEKFSYMPNSFMVTDFTQLVRESAMLPRMAKKVISFMESFIFLALTIQKPFL